MHFPTRDRQIVPLRGIIGNYVIDSSLIMASFSVIIAAVCHFLPSLSDVFITIIDLHVISSDLITIMHSKLRRPEPQGIFKTTRESLQAVILALLRYTSLFMVSLAAVNTEIGKKKETGSTVDPNHTLGRLGSLAEDLPVLNLHWLGDQSQTCKTGLIWVTQMYKWFGSNKVTYNPD